MDVQQYFGIMRKYNNMISNDKNTCSGCSTMDGLSICN